MWKEFYVDNCGPRNPDGWCFVTWALEDLVRAYDEKRTKDAWQLFKDRLAKDVSLINEPRPKPRFLKRYVGLLDLPRATAETELDLLLFDKRDQIAGDFDFAMSLVGRQAEAGNLLTACRDKNGGPLIDLDRGVWGIDDFWPRLSQCALNPDAPFDLEAHPTHWIFFEDDSIHWLVDNERIELGLEPKWHRRIAPKNEQKFALFPGIMESQRLVEHWSSLRRGKAVDTGVRIDNFQPATVKSGAPGRPTSMHLVNEIFERRIANGELADDQLAESRALSAALNALNQKRVEQGYEPHTPLLPTSIRPKIADRYKSAKAALLGGAKTSA